MVKMFIIWSFIVPFVFPEETSNEDKKDELGTSLDLALTMFLCHKFLFPNIKAKKFQMSATAMSKTMLSQLYAQFKIIVVFSSNEMV